MREISHHPRTELLADFAAGRLDEARAVVIATHAALCGECARAISDFEALGGALLDAASPVALADDALEKIIARADATANVAQPASDLTRPQEPAFSRYLKGSLDDVRWKTIVPGVAQHVVMKDKTQGGVLRLLKIAPGVKMMKHSHGGEELTLIVKGAYEDEIGRFSAGDLADLDGGHTHAPKAIGDEPCICLTVSDAPLRFKSLLGRIAQPIFGM